MRVLRISHSAVVDAWRERERAIRRQGVDVHLLSARRWDEGGTSVPLSPHPDDPVEDMATLGSHPALFVYDPRPLWRLLGERWDVIDIHEEPFALATFEVLLLRALRRQRAPYILYSAQNIDKSYPVPFRWGERWSLRHASAITTCSEAAADIVSRKGFPGVPDVIALGLDTAHFTPGSPMQPRTQGKTSVLVGYVGRLAPHKGVDILIDAVAGDDRLVLLLAGGGPSEQDLRERVTVEGLGARVTFLGALPQSALPDFYRGLDVLAVPSLTTPGWLEQFGRVAVEAMACGVPIVASDSGALPDVVGGAGLLVPPGDAAALRVALLAVGLDDDLALSLRAVGIDRARSCDWDAVAGRYVEMYRRATHQLPLQGELAQRGLEVVVVAFGSPDLLRRSLEPLAELPIIVVDNSSLPEIRDLCLALGVRYLDPGRNGGFAAGVNAGLASRQVPDGDVLLLNPDAIVSAQDVRELHRAMLADPGLASVGPVQVNDEGEAARIEWPFPSPAGTWLEALGLGGMRSRTGFVIGSVLLLRAEALAQVGPLDERFFLYAEETDWAFRASRLGWRHAVIASAAATHLGAATSSDATRREAHFHGSQERYLRKHFGATGWQVARAGQILGATVRAVVLPGPRGRAARARLSTYLRGPLRVERSYGGPASPRHRAEVP